MKHVKDRSGHETCTRAAKACMRAIKFHPYYYVLGFTFPMSLFYAKVICFMRFALAQCPPNAIRAMVEFF